MRAFESLVSGRNPLGVTFLDSLDRRLARGREPGFIGATLEEYQFVLLGTNRDVEDTLERIMAWFGPDDGRGDDGPASRGRVVMAEVNRPMQYGSVGLGRPGAAGIGAPLTFSGDHITYLQHLRVAAAHHAGITGKGVRVAIVDSGIDAGGVKAAGFYDVTTATPAAPTTQSDTDGHGTAMAQIVREVAPDCAIYGVRVVATGEPKLFDTMTGMAVAVFECAADIVNLSLSLAVSGTCPQCGGGRESTLTYFTRSLSATTSPRSRTRTGIVIVASTGNTGLARGFRHPAACDVVVAVGAVNTHSTRSRFSTHGTRKNRYLMAPGGDDALSSSPAPTVLEHVGTGSSGASCYGTSPACAYAAGMFALFWSNNPSFDADGLIDDVLHNHCNVPAHAANPPEYGAGVIEF